MQSSTIHPNLTVADPAAAIAFYERAFGATLVDQVTADTTIIHSDLRIGGSTFTVAAEFPGSSAAPDPSAPSSVSFTLNVEDAAAVDATVARAAAAGATVAQEPSDWFAGFRQAEVRCPAGHRWFVVHVDPSVTVDDVQRASDAWSSAAD